MRILCSQHVDLNWQWWKETIGINTILEWYKVWDESSNHASEEVYKKKNFTVLCRKYSKYQKKINVTNVDKLFSKHLLAYCVQILKTMKNAKKYEIAELCKS